MHQVEDLFEADLRLLRPLFTNSLILVPFLPLTRQHVKQCIDQASKKLRIKLSSEDIRQILDLLDFSSKSFPVYATYGCTHVKEIIKSQYFNIDS